MDYHEYLNNFQIVDTFKDSGQKLVYLAIPKDGSVDRLVIKTGITANLHDVKRAKREVEIQNTLQSEFYPKNFDFRIFDANQFVIVEEFIESEPLSECFGRFNEPIKILELLLTLVNALDQLWAKNITHRDLKPDNILIRSNNHPVIIDLGIVLASDRSALTNPLALMSPCTPNYAAPEQLKNRRADIDHRTDQFILGIVMAFLIENGCHPFDPLIVGIGDHIPENIINANWVISTFGSDYHFMLKKIVTKLLAPEPFRRYRTPELLKKDIITAIGGKDEF